MEENNSIYDGLRYRLNQMEWPAFYMFKFIAPNEKVDDVSLLFYDREIILKPSKTGKYVSITSEVFMASPEEIITIYINASKISGVIAL